MTTPEGRMADAEKRIVPALFTEPMRICDLIEELKRFPPLMPVIAEGEGELAAVIKSENYEIVLQGAEVYDDEF